MPELPAPARFFDAACPFSFRVTKEPLNNTAAAERRVFCPIRAVPKLGNTQSIPPISVLSAESKSLATSSCRIIQRFLKNSNPFRHSFDCIEADCLNSRTSDAHHRQRKSRSLKRVYLLQCFIDIFFWYVCGHVFSHWKGDCVDGCVSECGCGLRRRGYG